MKAVVTHRHHSTSQRGWDFPKAVSLFLQLGKSWDQLGDTFCATTPQFGERILPSPPRPWQGDLLCFGQSEPGSKF